MSGYSFNPDTVDIIFVKEYSIFLELLRHNPNKGKNTGTFYVYWHGEMAPGQTSRLYRCWSSENAKREFTKTKETVNDVLTRPLKDMPLFVNEGEIVGFIARKRLENG